MQMTTSSYMTAFHGVRAVWGWLRKKGRSNHQPSPRQQAIEQVELECEMDMIRAESEREIARVRAESQAARLEPVMAMFATVQANKRARLQLVSTAPVIQGPSEFSGE
jgi:hypothetical protein